jgi:hypothetical protein
MANFQESRILGLSPRAVWLTLAVVAVVVALFFIPPAIKFLFEGAGRSGKAKAPAAVAVQPSQSGTQKAALNTEKLQQVSTDLTSLNGKPGPKSQQGKKVDNVDQGGGFFSGWNFKVKARGGTGNSTMSMPAISLPAMAFCARSHASAWLNVTFATRAFESRIAVTTM